MSRFRDCLGQTPKQGRIETVVPHQSRLHSGRITVAVGSRHEGGSRGGPVGHIEGGAVTEGPVDLNEACHATMTHNAARRRVCARRRVVHILNL